eukprot:1155666-Pelagomonas_calceolata.AAC.1
MVGRDLKKLEAAAAAIRKEIGKSAKLEIIQCDLSNMEGVPVHDPAYVHPNHATSHPGYPPRGFSDTCNASAGCYFPGPFKLVKGNLEQTMAVNFFAPALLTLSLLDKVKHKGVYNLETGPRLSAWVSGFSPVCKDARDVLHLLRAEQLMQSDGRIVMMSSEGEAMGKVDWENLRSVPSDGGKTHCQDQLRKLGIDLQWSIKLAQKLHAFSMQYAHELTSTRRAFENKNTQHNSGALGLRARVDSTALNQPTGLKASCFNQKKQPVLSTT